VNLREGTRRLALLLGVVGAILGGIASYFQLQPVLAQRALQNKFESLAASEVVQQERKLLPPKGTLSQQDILDLMKIQLTLPDGDPRQEKISSLIGQYAKPQIDPKTGEVMGWRPQIDPKTGERIQATPDFIPYTAATAKKTPPLPKGGNDKWQEAAADSEAMKAWQQGAPSDWKDVSLVNKGGIKTIVWAENHAVYSIETAEGEVLRPTPPQSLWAYFLAASFPALGFFIPWGAVRAIGWVGAGFFPPPK
jgi:hypothetical protein